MAAAKKMSSPPSFRFERELPLLVSRRPFETTHPRSRYYSHNSELSL